MTPPLGLAATGTSGWQSLVVLVPALVIGGGLAVAVFLVLGRALAADIRESGHRRAIYTALLALLAVAVLLTYLGIKLPKE